MFPGIRCDALRRPVMNSFFAFEGVGKRGITSKAAKAPHEYVGGAARERLLQAAREQRAQRERNHKREAASRVLQKAWRGRAARKRLAIRLRDEVDAELRSGPAPEAARGVAVRLLLVARLPAPDLDRLVSRLIIALSGDKRVSGGASCGSKFGGWRAVGEPANASEVFESWFSHFPTRSGSWCCTTRLFVHNLNCVH